MSLDQQRLKYSTFSYAREERSIQGGGRRQFALTKG